MLYFYSIQIIVCFLVIANTNALEKKWRTYYLHRDCIDSKNNSALHQTSRSRSSWFPQETPRVFIDLSLGGAAIVEASDLPSGSPPPRSSPQDDPQQLSWPQDKDPRQDSDPDNQILACEVFVQAPTGLKVLLQLRNLYIPTSSEGLCDENYLFLFDSNTPRFRAMPEAGGEKGLCQVVDKLRPIFTSGPYLTAVFRSSMSPVNQRRPGFQFILTAVAFATDNANCPASLPPPSGGALSSPASPPTHTDLSPEPYSFYCGNTAPVSSSTVSKESSGVPGYCVHRGLVCDGVPHCHASLDEEPHRVLCGAAPADEGPLSRFLLLGMHASIGIAVCAILFFIVLISVCVCCCYRCCHGTPSKSPAPRVLGVPTNSIVARSHPQLYTYQPAPSATSGSACSFGVQGHPQQALVMSHPGGALYVPEGYQPLLAPQGSECSWTTGPHSGVLMPATVASMPVTETSLITTPNHHGQPPQALLLYGGPVAPTPGSSQHSASSQPNTPATMFALQHQSQQAFHPSCPSPYFGAPHERTSDNASRTSSQSSGPARYSVGSSSISWGYPAPRYVTPASHGSSNRRKRPAGGGQRWNLSRTGQSQENGSTGPRNGTHFQGNPDEGGEPVSTPSSVVADQGQPSHNKVRRTSHNGPGSHKSSKRTTSPCQSNHSGSRASGHPLPAPPLFSPGTNKDVPLSSNGNPMQCLMQL